MDKGEGWGEAPKKRQGCGRPDSSAMGKPETERKAGRPHGQGWLEKSLSPRDRWRMVR